MLGFALLLSTALSYPSNVALGPAPAQRGSSCPSLPGLPVVPNAQTCPALEVTGRADAAGVVLDPAFAVVVPASQLTRSGRADAVLSGFSSDGRSLFTFAFEVSGPFHLFVPLAPATALALTRLHLATATGSTEQVPVAHGDPDAEVVAVDDSHVLFAWNAQSFPQVRIATALGAPPIATGVGRSTYQQMTFSSSTRRIFVDFSDGIHSTTRSFRIFGRV